MLTNPPTSSTSVSSSSLVEVTTLTSPSPSTVTAAAATTTTQETTVGTVPAELHSEQQQTQPTKRKKKGTGQRLELAAGAGGLVPCNPPENQGNDNNSKKRSRKQKIDTLPDSYELSPFVARQSVPEKPGKRRKTASKSSGDNDKVNDSVSAPGNKRKNVNKNNVNKSRVSSSGLQRKTSKKSTSATATSSTTDNSVVSYDPKQKIVLKRNEFIDPNLSFTIFPDLSRGLGAIGPSQVILAVESTREPGTQDELISDSGVSGGNNSSKKPIEFQCQTLSLFLSVPHFLPLTSVYNSGEPFARILRYSALEQYTKGVLGRNQVSTFRFYGPRYEKQVPSISAAEEKNPQILQIRKKIPNPNAYLESVLIIKHPILGFYSRKLVNLNFIILKKIYLGDQKNTIIGHLKAKVVQLRRSVDLKNIEIYVDESRVNEAAADANAMNHQNIQPVIQTPSGLVPVITRTTYQAQQEYQIEEQPQQIVEAQFQYVPYHYQTSTELVQEIASNSGDGISNLIFNLDNTSGEYFGGTPTFRDENGARVLILSPGEFQSVQSSSSFVTHPQTHQQVIHHQSEPTSIYTSQEQQPVIIQQHQQFSAAQQLQLHQQQQQAYTIQQNQPQQEHQQIIQIQQAEPIKEVQRQILYIPGTGSIPIEIQFEQQVVEPTTRVYTQQQPRSEQLQVQVQSQQHQQFRSGQQIVVQQHQNQYQVQQHPQTQPLGSSQNQVAIRQHQHHLTSPPQQVGTISGTTQTFQHRSATQQQQVIVQQTQQQQSHVHQQQQQQQSVVSSSSLREQVHHHHPVQLNQIQGIQSATQSQQVRFQSAPGSPLQQQTQSLIHTQVQSRPQLIQQQILPALQSPPTTVPAASSQHYHSQRATLQQQQSQVPPQQQHPQFALGETRAPLSSSIPQALPPASLSKQKNKAKQPNKGSQKKSAKEAPTKRTFANSGLSDHQLEQLQQRSLGYQPPCAPPPPQLANSPQGPIRAGSVTPPYAAPPSVGALRPVVSPQQPQLRLLQSPVKKSGQPLPRSQRPPAPPPPIISSTTSLARFPSVSSGTTTVGNSVAPKSQISSASSTTLTSLPESVTTSFSPSSPGKKPKTFYVVPTASAPTSPVAATLKPEFRSKPGHLAVCPHCGVGNRNILRCNRCKHELPADVKFIKDEWEVNKGGAAVAIPAPNTSAPTTSTLTSTTTGTLSVVNNSKVSGGAAAASKNKTAVGRKILLVNKPQPPVPAVQGSTPIVVNNTIVAPGTVHVQIQPDGGSSVTIGGVVQGKPVVSAKPAAPKRRAPARKRQALECITLSSDEEEPESPKPKVARQEEVQPKSAETTASPLVASAKSTTANTPTPVVTAATNASSTITSNVSVITKANSVVVNSCTEQVQPVDANKTVISVKKEQELATSSVVIANADNTATMPKKMKINLSLDTASTSGRPGKEESSTNPDEVYNRIEEKLGSVSAETKFEWATFVCRSIRVGSYKVTSTDVGIDLAVQLTELGLKFNLPLANFKRKVVKMCIPKESILNMKVHFTKRLQVIFIRTGPKYGSWARQALGLDGSATNETSNYYCPLEGKPCQQTITFLGDNLEDSDVGLIKKMYHAALEEIEYGTANEILMKITPQSYQSSIGFNTNSGEPLLPRIVSTVSKANVSVPSPPGSTLSTASTVIVKEPSTPAFSSGASSVVGVPSNINKDAERNILFYEGRNNIKVPICPNDINCLSYSSFLNDQIIDFWMAVIQTEILSEEDKNRTFIFDSFFYSKLTEKMKRRVEEDGNMTAGERRHSRVKKRTKNVDIFSKDFLIVPINENYHWFIAIICFPGMEGYHDYNTLERLPNYKRPRTTGNKATTSSKTANNNSKKPVVYNQPQNDTTSSYSCRDEAPEDPEENEQISSPDTPATDGSSESKSQGKTEAGESSTGDKAGPVAGAKRKSEFGQAVKHPCILIFDSLAGEARGRIYSTLREYLRIEYKTKKRSERVFDKTTMPGIMPKVPQQPNFSDCGLFMLQYVESFFSDPIPTFDPKEINLKQWFPPSIAENKRREIYDFIKKKIHEKYPENAGDIPTVRFEPDENDILKEEAYMHQHFDEDDLDEDEDYEDEYDSSDDEEDFRLMCRANKSQKQQPGKMASSDSDDHNYATTPSKPMSTAEFAASLPTVVVAISPLPSTSDTTTKKHT